MPFGKSQIVKTYSFTSAKGLEVSTPYQSRLFSKVKTINITQPETLFGKQIGGYRIATGEFSTATYGPFNIDSKSFNKSFKNSIH